MAATASNRVAWHGRLLSWPAWGLDWRHDVSALWRTWFAASTQSILLRMVLNRLRFSRHFWTVTLRFAWRPFSLGPGFVACCNICNGASSELPWVLQKIKYFRFKLLIFPVYHPAIMTSALVKSLLSSTADAASLYTSSSILAASYQAHIHVKICILQPLVNKIQKLYMYSL